MMLWNGGAGWAGWLLMSVGMVAFWLLLFMAIRALLPGVQDARDDCRRGRPKTQAALRVLGERLARGEMDVQEYRTSRELLYGPESVVSPAQVP